MKRRNIIAIDFDGTLFTDEYPEVGNPKWRVINYCKERQSQGDILILWTCRYGADLQEAIEACEGVGLHFDYVNENAPYDKGRFAQESRKIYGDLYLDDKAVNVKELYK